MSCALMLGACGGGKHQSPAATQSAGASRAAVRQVIDDTLEAFTHAQERRLCGLMAAPLRDALVKAIGSLLPSLAGRPCGQVIQRFYRHLPPSHTPPAINEADSVAGDASWNHITVHGPRAIAGFPDGGRWEFEKSGGRWLITRFPIFPKAPDHQQMPAQAS